jgi:hypothetical protein
VDATKTTSLDPKADLGQAAIIECADASGGSDDVAKDWE